MTDPAPRDCGKDSLFLTAFFLWLTWSVFGGPVYEALRSLIVARLG